MSAVTDMQGDFVMLRAGGLRLVLPQAEVGAAEYLAARPAQAAERGVFRIAGEGGERLYAALAQDMTLLADMPAERFVAASLAGDAAGIGWCWDELRVLIGAKLRSIAVPSALVDGATPVSRYVEVDGEIAFVCSAERLADFALARGTQE